MYKRIHTQYNNRDIGTRDSENERDESSRRENLFGYRTKMEYIYKNKKNPLGPRAVAILMKNRKLQKGRSVTVKMYFFSYTERGKSSSTVSRNKSTNRVSINCFFFFFLSVGRTRRKLYEFSIVFETSPRPVLSI